MTEARGWARPENRKKRVSRLVPATKTPRLSRLQLQIWRCLINAGGPQTTPQLVPWCFLRLTKFKPSHYSAVRRAAKKLCVRRMRTRAAATLPGTKRLWSRPIVVGSIA